MTLANEQTDPAVDESPLGLSAYRYPTGWFVVAWSTDVPAGTVKPLHYFGNDLVCFRGGSGRVSVLDAYCQHLGGNLGVGGHVEDDDIVCPWHGWHWDGDGANTLIPYSRERCKQNVRVRSWQCQEWCGMVLVWHDRDGRPPYWQPPEVPELETGDYYPLHPHSRMVNRVKVHPQMIVENAADPYHIAPVHKGDRPARTTSFELHDYYLHATVAVNYGGGKESTWLTPKGPVDATVVYDTYGLGIGFVRFPADVIATVQITGHTPVDDEYTDYFYTQASVREPGDTGDAPKGRALRFIQVQQEIIKQDFFTWENMRYLPKPNFAVEEARDYAALRRWARRFYPPDAPTDDDGNGGNGHRA